jgi:hypothetical protein
VAAQVAVPFPSFPPATFGTFNTTFDLTLSSTYTSGFISFAGGTAAAAEATLIAAMGAGNTYVNIHDSQFPGGEIRGQLSTPEPGTVAAALAGLLLVIARSTSRAAASRRS